MTFRPGQRVRCINDIGWMTAFERNVPGPVCGRVYLVIGGRTFPYLLSQEPREYLYLAEFGDEVAYEASGFAPIEDQQLDVLRANVAGLPAPNREIAAPRETAAPREISKPARELEEVEG